MVPLWAKITLLLLIAVVLLFGIRACIYYPLWRAKHKAIPVTPRLVAEARAILHENETSGTEMWWDVAGNMPPAMEALNPQWIRLYHGGEAVNLQLTGGFNHTGLIVVPDPGTLQYTTFEETDKMKRINDHLWEYAF